jgi:single-stranded DNA-binding protein
MAKVIRNPELRYTQDTQIPFAQMLVEFEGSRPEDPPATLKVVGWGEKLAPEIQENYTEGDNLIIEGRLSMNTIERPEGFKEKRAELRASRIYRVEGLASAASTTSTTSTTPATAGKVVPLASYKPPQTSEEIEEIPTKISPTVPLISEPEDQNDPIPF